MDSSENGPRNRLDLLATLSVFQVYLEGLRSLGQLKLSAKEADDFFEEVLNHLDQDDPGLAERYAQETMAYAWNAHSQSLLEMSRGSYQLGLATLRGLFLLNGGAAVAMMAFLGNVWNSEAGTEMAPVLAKALLAFSLGLVLSLFSSACAWFSQIAFNRRSNRWGIALRACLAAFGFLSASLFLCGVWIPAARIIFGN